MRGNITWLPNHESKSSLKSGTTPTRPLCVVNSSCCVSVCWMFADVFLAVSSWIIVFQVQTQQSDVCEQPPPKLVLSFFQKMWLWSVPQCFYSFTREPQLSLTAHWIHSVPMVTMLRPRAGPEEARPFLLPSVVLLSFFAAVVEAASAWQMNNHQVVVCFSLGSSYLNSDGETPDWTLCNVTRLRE